MKAEHRKELETNALAERMGRVVKGMKQAPQKRTLLYLVIVGIAVVAVLLFVRRSEMQRVENSQRWLDIADGAGPFLGQVIEKAPQSTQAKVAQYQVAYARLREMLRIMATNPKQALDELDTIEKTYRELAKLCKGDKVLEPEALFAQAVIKETRIREKDENWEEALAAYKEITENHPNSAFAKFANQRVKVLEDKDRRNEMLKVYRDLRITFPVREDRLPELPKGHPPIAPDVPGIPRLEVPKLEVPKVDKVEPGKVEPAKVEPAKVEPAKKETDSKATDKKEPDKKEPAK